MDKIKDFDDLEVYKKSCELTGWVYDVVDNNFPRPEIFASSTQSKRAVTSIGANIAEGFGCFHYKENIQHCRRGRGSLAETKHWILHGHRRGWVSNEEYQEFLSKYRDLQVKLNNYIESIGKSDGNETTV